MLGTTIHNEPRKKVKPSAEPKKDVFGRLMKVGDTVAYNPVGKHKRMSIGEVIGFTPKMVRIKIGPDYVSNGRSYPQNITRYPGLCVLKHNPFTSRANTFTDTGD